MALMYTPTEINSFEIPEFSLPGVDGKSYNKESLNNFEATVFLFICNHCPYVQAIEQRIIDLYNKELDKTRVGYFAVCSNDASDYPEDSFQNIKSAWHTKKYNFPYLYDEDQSFAKNMGAICTPDIFVFDKAHTLKYRGRFDNNWKNSSQVTRQDLKLAVEATLKESVVNFEIAPSMGCSIKWKQ